MILVKNLMICVNLIMEEKNDTFLFFCLRFVNNYCIAFCDIFYLLSDYSFIFGIIKIGGDV